MPDTSAQLHGFEPYKEKKGEEYMNDKQLEHFRGILNGWKNELMEEVVQRAFKKGLLILGCGSSTVRFIPALSIPKELVYEGLEIFEEALTEAEEALGR